MVSANFTAKSEVSYIFPKYHVQLIFFADFHQSENAARHMNTKANIPIILLNKLTNFAKKHLKDLVYMTFDHEHNWDFFLDEFLQHHTNQRTSNGNDGNPQLRSVMDSSLLPKLTDEIDLLHFFSTAHGHLIKIAIFLCGSEGVQLSHHGVI